MRITVKRLLLLPLFWITLLAATNPTHAMLYSAFIPGGGQVYNHAYVKAGIVVGLQAYLLGNVLYNDSRVEDYKDKLQGSFDAFTQQQYKDKLQMYRERRTSDIWWMGVTCVLSMLDAYVDAHLADFEGEKAKMHLRFSDEQVQLELKF